MGEAADLRKHSGAQGPAVGGEGKERQHRRRTVINTGRKPQASLRR